jgi:uncharacterized damage-inducible protein DinB
MDLTHMKNEPSPMKGTTTSLMVLAVTALLTLLSFISIRQSAPVPAPRANAMIADWQRAKAYTLEYLSAADEELIAFKPTADMRTFGEQMLHIAESNYGFASAASGKKSPVTSGQLEKSSDRYKSKDSLTNVVMKSYDFVISALQQAGESEMDETIKIFNRFEMPRKTGFRKAFEHQTHHRGQTTVYLRLRGIRPPSERLL